MTYQRTAGDIVPFKPKPGIPTLTIGGRKYVLSTDGGPLGDRMDDDQADDFGGRLIKPPPGANKWRYLWVYDTDKQTLTMWRASDGNEKLHAGASSMSPKIIGLEKRGQLNRVTHTDFMVIEREMRRREDDALDAMKESIEAAKDEAERQLDRLLLEFFEKVIEPKLKQEIRAIHAGAIPLGFKPFGPALDGNEAWLLRQRVSYVLNQTYQRELTEPKVEAWLVKQGFDLSLVHNQAIEWAIQDLREKAMDKYLPPRPAGN